MELRRRGDGLRRAGSPAHGLQDLEQVVLARRELLGVLEHHARGHVGEALDLLEGWRRDAADGQPRLVLITGEPGLGKSRLLLELRRAVGARARFLEGRCLSYGAAVPYLPILDLVRGACGIADVDPPERAADKVRATLDALGGEGRDRAPYLLHLLGLKEESDLAESEDRLRELDGDVLMARTLDALRQLWLRTSRVLPLVLLVEDLHWIDAASEASLASLVESLGGARVLVVATYRPGYRPPWIDRSYATQISLGPLRRDESLGILRVLLPDLGSDDPLAALVLDRAEGNPFFLEELSHVVGDRAAGGLAVPDSVQGVLAARTATGNGLPVEIGRNGSGAAAWIAIRFAAALRVSPRPPNAMAMLAAASTTAHSASVPHNR